MIERLLNNPMLVHQTADDESDLPNPPLAVMIYNDNTMVITQEGRELCINLASVPELCKTMREMVKRELQNKAAKST